MKRFLSLILMVCIITSSIGVFAATEEKAQILTGLGRYHGIYASDGKYTLEPGRSYYVAPKHVITTNTAYMGPTNLANASATGDIKTYSMLDNSLLSESTDTLMGAVIFEPKTYKIITPHEKKQFYSDEVIVNLYGEYRYLSVPKGATAAFTVSENANFICGTYHCFYKRYDSDKKLIDEGMNTGKLSLNAGDTLVVFSKLRDNTKYPIITEGEITIVPTSDFEEAYNGEYEIQGEPDVVVGGTSKYKVVDKNTGEEINNKIYWSSSDTKIAIMLSNGRLTAKKTGEMEITASFFGSKTIIRKTISVREPKMEDICFDIDNSIEEFGISDMPYKVYKATNNNGVVYNRLIDLFRNDGENGICAGICMTSMLLNQGYLNITDYGADKIYKISKKNKRIRNRILYEYLMQDDLYRAERKENKGKIDEIVEKAKNFQTTGKEPFIITIRIENNTDFCGHAIMPYRVEDEAAYTKIYVYDPNQSYSEYTNPDKKREAYIYLEKTDGSYNGNWRFEVEKYDGTVKNPFTSLNFSSKTQGAWISYVSYDTIVQETEKGSLYGENSDMISSFSLERPTVTLVRDAKDTDISNTSGNECNIRGYAMENTIEGLEYVVNEGITNSSYHMLTMPLDKYSLKGFTEDEAMLKITRGEAIATIKAKDSSNVEFEYLDGSISPALYITGESGESFYFENEYFDDSLKYDNIKISGTHGGNMSIVPGSSLFTVSGVSKIQLEVTTSGETVMFTQDNMNADETYTILIDGRYFYLKDNADAELTSVRAESRKSTSKPVAKLAEGEYSEAQVLEFEDVDADTVIYYTLDGSTPDTDSYIYSEPITIDKTMRIKAKAKKYGYSLSSTVTLDYTLPEVAAPTADTQSGTYDLTQKVTLSSATEGAQIYYTLDGSDPKTNGELYVRAIDIYNDCVLRTYAVAEGLSSDIAEYDYVISIDEAYVTNMQCVEGVVTVELEEAEGEKITVSVATYDENNRLKEVGYYEEVVDDGFITFDSGIKSDDVYIYVWKDMKPCR